MSRTPSISRKINLFILEEFYDEASGDLNLKLRIDILLDEVNDLVKFNFEVGDAVFGGTFTNILEALLDPGFHTGGERVYHLSIDCL